MTIFRQSSRAGWRYWTYANGRVWLSARAVAQAMLAGGVRIVSVRP